MTGTVREALLALFVLLTVSVFAQTPTPSTTDSQISDDAAMRAVFAQHKNHPENWGRIGFSAADQQVYATVMQQLKADTTHKKQVTTDAITYLKDNLSADGLAKLNAFVQKEKRHIYPVTGKSEPLQR